MSFIKNSLKFFRCFSIVKCVFRLQMALPIACLFSLSCTNNTVYERKKGRFKHNFQQGTADNLYNVSELLGKNPVLESKEKILLPPLEKDTLKIDPKFPPLSSTGGYPKNISKKGRVSGLLKIRTVEKGEKAIISFAQENIHIDPNISFINEYEFLDYEIVNENKTEWHKHLARLLGKAKFKGFPETDYYILPLFVGNYLILYKVGPPDKIPYDELPLARSVGNMLAVPFVGYPISYCVPEAVPDSNKRETGQYRPKCEGVKIKYAEYIRLNEGEKKIFTYKSKPDLFPRDFFNLKENEEQKDKWFYVRTVVKSPKNTIVGHQLFLPSNLVEFHPAPGKLDVLDASGYDIKPEDKIRTLFIPVEWIDYRIKRHSETLDPDFSEEERTNIHEKNLRYFKIKFDDLVENEIEYLGEKTLKDVFITDNYFSFNVEITFKNSGAYLVKFAFFKKPADKSAKYVPKQWFEKDSTLFFPSFSEKRRYYKKALDYSEADDDRFLRTTRFNPKAKEIKWYFSKQTPNDSENEWVRELGSLAIDLLNLAFEEAGKDSNHKMKMVLDKSEAKEVGDVRYNILNLIVSEGKSTVGLLGLGPNVANPITGEVVSATANVWVSNILNNYINLIKSYIQFQVYPPTWKMKPFSKDIRVSLQKQINKKTPKCGELYLSPISVTPFIYEKINTICPEVSDFIKNQKDKGLTYDPENPDLQNKTEIKSCAKKLAFLPILGTTLHEILHGLAQRHVFSASVDSENFYKDYNEIERIFGNLVSRKMKKFFGDFPFVEGTDCHPNPPQYSSVMDYMDLYNPMLFVPGKLDIAALRFIYFDKVDLKAGGVLNVPSGADRDPNNPQKSILQTAIAKNYQKEDLKNYKVLCGGEKIEDSILGEINPDQPLCKRFDYGTNPIEITINSILKTNSYLISKRNRYDSKSISYLDYEESKFKELAGHLYNKWKQYRDELLSQRGKFIEDYSFLNPEHIRQYQKTIHEEQDRNLEFKMYYDIRQPIFDYFKRLVFMPVKHCIHKKKLQEGFHYSVTALENIMTKQKGNYLNYPANSRARLINCKSPLVKAWAEDAENEKGELVAEVGFFSNTREYFLRPKANDVNDELSAFHIWKDVTDIVSPFFDIVMEPEFGNDFFQEFQAYMLQGTNVNPYIDEELIEDPDIPRDNTGRVNLNRVLSYKLDEKASRHLSDKAKGKSIFKKRWAILQDAINRLKNRTRHEELELHFDFKPRKLIDIGRTAESIENSSDYPFFTQAYENYPKKTEEKSWRDYISNFFSDDDSEQEETSFASFIKNHPATLYNRADGSFVIIPYIDTEENFPAQLFRRFNEFLDCMENQKKQEFICDDIEEKEKFTEIILENFYKEDLQYRAEEDSSANTGFYGKN